MLDPERLAAFAAMTAVTSVVPGVSMLFVMGQTIRRGWRGGAAALAGLQLGYLVWWALAALGLGTLARAFPAGFMALAAGGALYLAWLGVQALRTAGAGAAESGEDETAPPPARHALLSGVLVAIGNPKSLVYMVALIPPFVDARLPIVSQIAALAVIALVIDVLVGAAYIVAGDRLSRRMHEPAIRRRVDRVVGVTYLGIAMAILLDLVLR